MKHFSFVPRRCARQVGAWALLVMLALMTFCALPARAVTFSTSGGRILKDGSPFVVKGANIAGPWWYWDREVTQDADLIANVWKFNTVRVCMNTQYLVQSNSDGSTYDSKTANNDLNKIISAFTSRGVVTIIELHDWTGSYPNNADLDRMATFFRDLALAQRGNPYVWFNPMNEPNGNIYVENDGADWLRVHRRIISEIRAQGNNSIIMVDGIAWGQEGGTWDASNNFGNSAILNYGDQLLSFNGQSYGNIVFSLHLYEQWGYDGGFYSEAKLANYLQRIKDKGYAFVIGEYGTYNAGKNTTNATNAMWKVLPSYPDVGRIVWQWDGADANDLTVWVENVNWAGSGWGIDRRDGVKPGNLTLLGSQVWDDNHSTSSGGSGGGTTSDLSNGIYRVVNNQHNRALTVPNSASDTQGISLTDANGANNQTWEVTSLGGGQYRLSPLHNTAQALDAWDGGNSDNVGVWQYGGGANQKWTITSNGDGTYRVINAQNNKALDAYDSSFVGLWTYEGNNNQKWRFEATSGDPSNLTAQ